jgi:hypothetical protein
MGVSLPFLRMTFQGDSLAGGAIPMRHKSYACGHLESTRFHLEIVASTDGRPPQMDR